MGARHGKMETMVIHPAAWQGRRVFLTGHTGFKGGWATCLLSRLGAEVHGYALAPETESLFNAARLADDIDHTIADIRDRAALAAALDRAQPSVVIHMAAQALVRRSYAEPVETYATNVMGTVHLLDAVRTCPSVEAVVIVTSDKCYANNGWVWGYRETDTLGGHDPYSNSKACAELVTDAYRQSFFSAPGAARVASARAGNVIGGGDWAEDRIVPDAVRAFLQDEPLRVRNPAATRPWQHVLDPLIGYLALAEHLLDGSADCAEAFNFGPVLTRAVPVAEIVDRLVALWGDGARWEQDPGSHPHEAAMLTLDSTKATQRLGWQPAIALEPALRLTVDWYRAAANGRDMRLFTLHQIETVLTAASLRGDAIAFGGRATTGNST